MSSLKAWVVEHKLASIGAFWASAVGASLAYNRKMSALKPSLRLIHARMHAQALTLAVLSGAALMHYYDAEYVKDGSGENFHPRESAFTDVADIEADRWSW